MTMTRKCSVRFDKKTNAFALPVDSNKFLSKSEQKSLWYSSKELKRMRLDLKRSLKSLAQSESHSTMQPTASIISDDDDSSDSTTSTSFEVFHWQGLHHLQHNTVGEVQQSRDSLVKGVLALQKLHKTMGLQDDIGLTLFTRAFTKDAAQQAQKIAKQASEEAALVYNEGKAR